MADKPPSTIYVRGIKDPLNLDTIFQKDSRLDFVLVSTQNPSNMAILSTTLFGASKSKPTNLLLSQTTPPLSPGIKGATLYISALIHAGKLERIGAKCTILRAYKNVAMNNQKISALQIEYNLPFVKLNVRASYRATLREGFDIMGIILLKNETFVSKELKGKKVSFAVENISTTGIAITFPEFLGKEKNPLAAIEKGQKFQMALKLQTTPDKPATLIKSVGVQAIRIDRKEDGKGQASYFLGARFFSLQKELKSSLSIFINKIMVAEIHERKKVRAEEERVTPKPKMKQIKPLYDYIFFGSSEPYQYITDEDDD